MRPVTKSTMRWNAVCAAFLVACGLYAEFPLWVVIPVGILAVFPVVWWPRWYRAFKSNLATRR